ncbi:DNA circularization N-terminal domain-containing protein [Carnobacterium sp.]|uniref:DNA circularization N-terminal domain-containing protein n=1 Tax=Carnobacterium sp. TaxID=48221 RepID=UPI00389031E3
MAWDTDVIEAVYTAPSGKKFTFQYDSKLTSETDLKTATFTFPERDGALVVPLGVGGRRFSFTCYYYGVNCRNDADSFEEGLKERGYGELQHPVYGTFKVVPTGTIGRSDDVVGGIGVSGITVTFSETIIEASVINSEVTSIDAINNAAEKFRKKSVLEFCKDIANSTIKGAIWVENLYKKTLSIATKTLSTIAKVEKEINNKFIIIESELWSSLDNFMNATEDVALHTVALMRLPAQTSINTMAKIDGYAEVINTIVNEYANNPFGIENAKNQWVCTRLVLESLVVGCAAGVAVDAGKNNFKSRNEAIEVANKLLDIYDQVVDYEEKNISQDYFIETGEGFASMRDLVSSSVSLIVNNSFSLPSRKTILLGRDRQIIELLYELYGDITRIDEFIIDNNLTYSDIEVIPMGREVAYYV